MKRRALSVVVMAALLLVMWSGVTFADNDIVTVVLDGKELEFDVPAQTINDRTMVPIRTIFENMGAIVEWDEATSSAICTKDSTIVKMTIDSKAMYINDQVKEMDVAPVVINGRTLAPARYVAEAFGADVNWEETNKTVYIETNAIDAGRNVPVGFTEGYELAVFSKFNSYASENELGGTRIYFDCTLDKIDFTNNESGVITGFLTDSNGNKWLAMLHSTFVVNETEYNSVIGKPIILCGVYEGYSSVYDIPALTLTELCVKDTGEIKSGMGKVVYINDGSFFSNNDSIKSEPVSNITLYSLDGRTIDVPDSEVSAYLNVGWYETLEETQQTMYAPDGRTITVFKAEVSAYKEVGWYETEYEAQAVNKESNDSPYTDGSSADGYYYRTPSGKRYHLDPNCGGKNSYRTTNISGLEPCKKCAQ